MYSTLNQGYVFAAVVIGGLGLGILYDIFRALRHTVKPGKVAEAFMDILFWLMATGVAVLVIFFANKGEPRLFIIIGLIGGAALYVVGPGTYIRKWFNMLFSKIAKAGEKKQDQKEEGKEENGS
jgi:spore cortex biosynthesis protein YabQ